MFSRVLFLVSDLACLVCTVQIKVFSTLLLSVSSFRCTATAAVPAPVSTTLRDVQQSLVAKRSTWIDTGPNRILTRPPLEVDTNLWRDCRPAVGAAQADTRRAIGTDDWRD